MPGLPPPTAAVLQDDRLIADRLTPRIYRVSGKADVHAFLLEAVRHSGGTVLYASGAMRVPVYLGIQDAGGDRLGLMVYPFRITRKETTHRPTDEVRGQLRYGAEEILAG